MVEKNKKILYTINYELFTRYEIRTTRYNSQERNTLHHKKSMKMFSCEGLLIGQYVWGDSFVHALDPRIKIFITVILSLAILLTRSFWGYVIIAGFLLVVFMVTAIPVKSVIKSLKPLVFILTFTFILHLFWTRGDIIFAYGYIEITSQGLSQGIFITCRLLLLVTIASIITLTTSPQRLTQGLERILYPLNKIKVPSQDIALMMVLALRFIPLLFEEAHTIMKAQKARGIKKNIIAIISPLMIRMFRRADEISLALDARCFVHHAQRTHFSTLHITKNDYITLSVSLCVGFVVVGM